MKINDLKLLERMKNLIFHDGDVRPVWIGPKIAETDNSEHMPYMNWANQHWGLYRGFINNVEKNKKLIILDLGCGCGFCTINLSDTFKDSEIIGYDIDEQSILFANEFNKNKKISYLSKNLLNNEFPKCDYIFLIETLEHIKHIYHYPLIDKCLNSLNKYGLLFISTPNENSFADSEKGHVGILTSKFFESFKEKYNKNILEIKYFDNKKLLETAREFTTDMPSSHFKIILKNEN